MMHFTGTSITDTLHKDVCLYLWKIKSLLREAPSLSEFNYEVHYKTVLFCFVVKEYTTTKGTKLPAPGGIYHRSSRALPGPGVK